ncbi:MAG: MBL fold metallo-hydrolase [Proteobacteria bacterium]|nr:MBL fold metallo-hydrolase [Pseudomonadota bacterium]
MSWLPVAEHWFERHELDAGVTLLRELHAHPLVRCNVWHVAGRKRHLLIDTGLGVASLRDAATDLFGKPLTVVATHAHFDHVGGMYEFKNERCVIHEAEAQALRTAADSMSLSTKQFGTALLDGFIEAGYRFEDEWLITALPHAEFNPLSHVLRPMIPIATLRDGDVVDLDNRVFEVLHLPGHSPGSIGLWESATGVLFSGDAIYDGPLLDNLPESNRSAYLRTMERLLNLEVTCVHAGHGECMGRARLREIARSYLDASDCRPADEVSRR